MEGKGAAFGHIDMADDGRVDAFLEKPRPGAGSGMINAGRYILDPALLETIPGEGRISLEKQWVPSLLGDEVRVFGLPWQGYFRPLNTPQDLLEAHRDLYERRWTPEWLSPLAPGQHLLGADCKVFPGARLGENVTLGEGTEVGPEAVLEDVVTLPGVRVGANARIHRTVLGHGAQVGESAVLTECVVGDRTLIPAWASLGCLDPGRRGEPE
jgi:mannose-1-phosphate guanylyltransferase